MGQLQGITVRGNIGRFYERLEAEMGRLWWPKLAMLMSSDQASETYKWLGMAPAMREWKTGRLAKGLRENGMTIDNKTWEATLKLDADDIRRDKTGQINVRIAEMAKRTAFHPQTLISTLIANGTGSTSGLCYDGHYFFDSDHEEGSSGSQTNLLTATEVTQLNVATATAPTQAEFALAILNVIAYMYSYVDDQGEPINGDAMEWLVMCPIPLFGTALGAVTNANLRDTSGVVIDNPLKGTPWNIQVVPNPRLTWTANFAVFRIDGAAKPFIFQEELPVQVEAIVDGSELAFWENCHAFGVKAINNAGYGLWQHAAHATLS